MLYKRGSVWWVKFERNGSTVRQSTHCQNHRDAETEARRIRNAFDAQPETQRKRPGPSGLTVDTLEAFDINRVRNEGLGELRECTIKEIWRPLIRILGERRIVTTMTVGDVLEYVGARRREGVKGQTIRREVEAVVRCLRIAKRDHAITHLPFDPDDLPTIRSDAPLECQRGKLRTEEQIATVFAHMSAKAVTAGHRDRCRLIMLTGLRLEELHRLQPEWVTDMVPVGDVVGMLDLPDTAAKWGGGRRIPLTREALDICRQRLPFRRVKPNKSLAYACEDAGLSWVLTPRDLRTWFLTAAGELDVTQARDLAGHADLSTTSLYQRGTDARAVATIQQVAQKAALPGTKGRHNGG